MSVMDKFTDFLNGLSASGDTVEESKENTEEAKTGVENTQETATDSTTPKAGETPVTEVESPPVEPPKVSVIPPATQVGDSWSMDRIGSASADEINTNWNQIKDYLKSN